MHCLGRGVSPLCHNVPICLSGAPSRGHLAVGTCSGPKLAASDSMFLRKLQRVKCQRDSVKCATAGRSHNANAAAAHPMLRRNTVAPQQLHEDGKRDGLERVFNMATTPATSTSETDQERKYPAGDDTAAADIEISNILQEAEALTQSFEALQAKREPSRKNRGRARAEKRYCSSPLYQRHF